LVHGIKTASEDHTLIEGHHRLDRAGAVGSA
jgi:hypothetical protein